MNPVREAEVLAMAASVPCRTCRSGGCGLCPSCRVVARIVHDYRVDHRRDQAVDHYRHRQTRPDVAPAA